MAKGRRGNNEGSITQRPDGRWEARISLPDGKRKSFYGKTRKEVASKLAEAVRDLEKGLPVVTTSQTIEQYMATWVSIVASSLEETTLELYKRHLRIHILPHLGKIPLSKLSIQQVQKFYADKLEAGYAAKTVRTFHDIINRALKDAVQAELIQRNVAERVKPPKVQRREMKTFTVEQAKRFLSVLEGERFEAFYWLAISTAMRQGELIGLKWSAVDLDRGLVFVQASAKRIRGKMVVGNTKTPHSRRRIALTPFVVEKLRTHRERQQQERFVIGDKWHDNDLVFPNLVGNPYNQRDFNTRRFKPFLRKAGLPDIRFHDLRHTAATLLFLKGVHPKVVSEMLGHASVTITMDLYGHVLPDMQRGAATSLGDLLAGDDEDDEIGGD